VGIFRSIRRSRILREGLLTEEAWEWLLKDHPILDGLSREEKDKLRGMATIFLHEKTFEGADGLSPTEVIRDVISVQACLPILNLGMEWYENWKTIVVVPDVFTGEHSELDDAGVTHEWEEDSSGESWDTGPVVLSWKDVEESGWGDGYNVVIHEAAHRLDHIEQVETIAKSHRHPFARVLCIIVDHDHVEGGRTLLLRKRRQQTVETFGPSVSRYAHAHLRMLATIWSDHESTADAH